MLKKDTKMRVSEFKKLQAQKLKEQKIKPIQKVSNSFIDSTLHKSNLPALKTIYYLSTILDKFDHTKELDTLTIDLRQMLKYSVQFQQVFYILYQKGR